MLTSTRTLTNAHTHAPAHAHAHARAHGAALPSDPPGGRPRHAGSGSPGPGPGPSSPAQSLSLGPVATCRPPGSGWRAPGALVALAPGLRNLRHLDSAAAGPWAEARSPRAVCAFAVAWHKPGSPAALPRGEGDHAAAPLGVQGPLRGAKADGGRQEGGNTAAERASGRRGERAAGKAAQRGRLGRRDPGRSGVVTVVPAEMRPSVGAHRARAPSSSRASPQQLPGPP